MTHLPAIVAGRPCLRLLELRAQVLVVELQVPRRRELAFEAVALRGRC